MVAEGIPVQRLPVAALDVVLHRMAIGIPTRVQQSARGIRHHVAGIVVRQLELTVGVQPGDAVERQGLGCRKHPGHSVAFIFRHNVVKRSESLYAVEAVSIDNAVTFKLCDVASLVIPVVYREVGYAVSLDGGPVRQTFGRSEHGGSQTIERVIRVCVAALGPCALGDVAVIARRVFQRVADGGSVCRRAVCGLL